MSRHTGEKRQQAILNKLFSSPIPINAKLDIIATAIKRTAEGCEQSEVLAELRGIYDDALPAIDDMEAV